MTDPKPYTPEELAADFPLDLLDPEDQLEMARVRATVQALAAAQSRVKELEAEIQDLRIRCSARTHDSPEALTAIRLAKKGRSFRSVA